MRIKGITDEDFVNYKVPSMLIATARCTFKCDLEYGSPVCQNSDLDKAPVKNIQDHVIVDRYIHNPITSAIVFGGLEPIDQFDELLRLISLFRTKCQDDIVIYTGYQKEEIVNQLGYLAAYRNIIVKFGRYIPDQQPHYDPVLGVYLASDNQYAERIS